MTRQQKDEQRKEARTKIISSSVTPAELEIIETVAARVGQSKAWVIWRGSMEYCARHLRRAVAQQQKAGKG